MAIATTIEKYKSPPRTAMEVYEMLPEGTLAEVINNVLYMSPAPSFEHQDLLGDLFTDINIHVRNFESGKCVFSPVDVYLGDKNAIQPDIVFIAANNLGIIRDGKIKGAPDLIIEVLSGNKKYDLQIKKSLYETFGVKEYFIIDPSDKSVVSYYYDGKSKLLKKVFAF